MDNVKKICKQEDKFIIKLITSTWLTFTLICAILCLYLDYDKGDRVILVWGAVTVGALLLNSIKIVSKLILVAISSIKFSVLLIFSIPLFILIYGASNLPYHIERHSRMFMKVQSVRLGLSKTK